MDMKEKLLEKLIDALLVGGEGDQGSEEASENGFSEIESKPEFCDGCDRLGSECVCESKDENDPLKKLKGMM